MKYMLSILNNNQLCYFVDYLDEECTKLLWSRQQSRAQVFDNKEQALRFKRVYLQDRKAILLSPIKIIH